MRSWLLMFIASTAFGDCTPMDVLQQIRPGAEWSITGNTYNGLIWLDQVQTKPTLQEVQDAMTTCQANVLSLRQQAQNDIFNVKLATNTAQVKLQSLIDLMQIRGQLQ